MTRIAITKKQDGFIDDLVEHFVANRSAFDRLVDALQSNITKYEPLFKHVHSIKWRIKEPSHLKDKLIRKLLKAKRDGKTFDITKDNLFTKINDLVGFRILHLYTRQIGDINRALNDLIEDQLWRLVEGPCARTWDNESRDYFKAIGIDTKDSDTMYTSVHYIIEPNTRNSYTCEIQVRTLMEEVWGEVDHTINYPHPSDIVACVEQIKVLARVTSSCSRLVDSIFTTHNAVNSTPMRIATRGTKKSQTKGGTGK